MVGVLNKIVLACLASLTLATGVMTDGRRMLEAEERADWRGVGRLNFGSGFCTGALIAPDLAATAAHCLFTRRTGARRAPERVHFVAGYRLGRHEGHRTATRLSIHPGYEGAETGAARVSRDLALMRLESPIEGAQVFGVGDGLAAGDEVAILSYGRDRPEIASIQSPCAVAARRGAVAVLDCDVTYGVSGAPVFRRIDGDWKIVAVVSAMGSWRGAMRAFAVTLDAALPAVLEEAAIEPASLLQPRKTSPN